MKVLAIDPGTERRVIAVRLSRTRALLTDHRSDGIKQLLATERLREHVTWACVACQKDLLISAV